MNLGELTSTLKEYARDVRLNLSSVLTEEGAPGLTRHQIWSIALACAYASRQIKLVKSIEADCETFISPEVREAAKGAAVVMAMNNVYYRFTHLLEDKAISTMPARLRMSVIGKPGVPKIDFELMSLAVSALNGCGACMNAHAHEVSQGGISNEGIQSTVRIASVIISAAQALSIQEE